MIVPPELQDKPDIDLLMLFESSPSSSSKVGNEDDHNEEANKEGVEGRGG